MSHASRQKPRLCLALKPSAPLSLNTARVALANHLFARHGNGHLMLRFDNAEERRDSAGAMAQAVRDLRWIGIEWDHCVRQSERRKLYDQAIDRLRAEGLLYPCFESNAELRAKQEHRRKRHQPLIYDRAMLQLTEAQRSKAEAGGKRPYWRLRLSGRELMWRDLVLGSQAAKLSAISDPVLVDAAGNAAPDLRDAVDAIDAGITHIIRGDANAIRCALQIELLEHLTRRPVQIRFAHLPSLSNRQAGAMSIRALRNDGIEARALAACLAGRGDSTADPPALTGLAADFRLASLAQADVDISQILAVNRCVLRGLDFNEVADRLPPGATERFWLAIRGSLDLLKEARNWWEVTSGTVVPPLLEGERSLLTQAADLLPPEPWDGTVWARWVGTVQTATGRVAESLLGPLRLALTGEDTGPDAAVLLPLIGRKRAIDRLRIAAA